VQAANRDTSPAKRALCYYLSWGLAFLMSRRVKVRSRSYFIMESSERRRKCQEITPVYGFVVDGGELAIVTDSSEGDCVDKWVSKETPTMLCFIYLLPQTAVTRIAAFTRHYRC
jgi:hypothetical protein